MTAVLLVHGGLWEDMDAARFWRAAGIDLAALAMPAGVVPSVPANPVHQRRTADALLRLLRRAQELPGCPEPPSPAFPPHREHFLDTVAAFATA